MVPYIPAPFPANMPDAIKNTQANLGPTVGPALALTPTKPTFNPVNCSTLTRLLLEKQKNRKKPQHIKAKNKNKARTETKTKTKTISLAETRAGKTIFNYLSHIYISHPQKEKNFCKMEFISFPPLACVAIFAHFLSYKYFPCNSFPGAFATWIPLLLT